MKTRQIQAAIVTKYMVVLDEMFIGNPLAKPIRLFYLFFSTLETQRVRCLYVKRFYDCSPLSERKSLLLCPVVAIVDAMFTNVNETSLKLTNYRRSIEHGRISTI